MTQVVGFIGLGIMGRPMAKNLLKAGHAVVKDRVNAIALAPAEDFRRDSNIFGDGVRDPEAQLRIRNALKRGFQSRDVEMDLAGIL